MQKNIEYLKWITINHRKGWSSSKEGDVEYIMGLEGSLPLLLAQSGEANDQLKQVFLITKLLKSSNL